MAAIYLSYSQEQKLSSPHNLCHEGIRLPTPHTLECGEEVLSIFLAHYNCILCRISLKNKNAAKEKFKNWIAMFRRWAEVTRLNFGRVHKYNTDPM